MNANNFLVYYELNMKKINKLNNKFILHILRLNNHEHNLFRFIKKKKMKSYIIK